jgi:POT family proton-dependent oligopeptide transporter
VKHAGWHTRSPAGTFPAAQHKSGHLVAEQIDSARRDKAFLGHPAGLGWLAATEFWERFSFYGMLTLLVLYMTDYLLKPGHVEHVVGFALFSRLVSAIYHPANQQAFASAVYGLYASLVYVTPLAGGYLADRFLGRTRTVAMGACLMALGHFLMAFEASFLFALLCLLLGVGCFKGNLATQVGDLYGKDDPRRADAFQIYFLAIQFAVIGSPILCGWLADHYGWHWGFGVAGIGMLVGLTIYLLGRSTLPAERVKEKIQAPAREPLTASDWRTIAILIVLVPVLATTAVGNQEIFNAYLVWAKRSYDLHLFGYAIPVFWLISFDSIMSVATMAGAVAFWRWWATRWPEPDELLKITIGAAIAATAPLALAAAATVFSHTGHRVTLWWGVAFELLNDIGFANVFPVGLALYSRAAPKGLGGTLVAIYLLNQFMCNFFVGWLGGRLELMDPAAFWTLHAALIAGATLILFAAKFTIGRSLAPAYAEVAPA